MRNKLLLLIAIILLPLCTSAYAETALGTLNVTATVISSCSIGGAGSLSFGSYDADGATDTTANTGTSIQVTCNGDTTWSMFSTESDVTKIMQNTSVAQPHADYQLSYTLYTDAAMTIPLAVTNTTGTITGTGTGSAQNAVIYGKIAKGQAVFTGTYAQTINLTLVY